MQESEACRVYRGCIPLVGCPKIVFERKREKMGAARKWVYSITRNCGHDLKFRTDSQEITEDLYSLARQPFGTKEERGKAHVQFSTKRRVKIITNSESNNCSNQSDNMPVPWKLATLRPSQTSEIDKRLLGSATNHDNSFAVQAFTAEVWLLKATLNQKVTLQKL